MAGDYDDDEQIIEQLKKSVDSIARKAGRSKFTEELIAKIQSLQSRLENLTAPERTQFLREMRDSFRTTIEKIESKLLQHAHFEKVYNCSILAAVVVSILFIFALFGYKLYRSLAERELKKQEKLKNKQSKKAKKLN